MDETLESWSVDNPSSVDDIDDDDVEHDVIVSTPLSTHPGRRRQVQLTSFFTSKSDQHLSADFEEPLSTDTPSAGTSTKHQIVPAISPAADDLKEANRPGSLLWKYFSKTEKEKATCSICKASVSMPSGCTTGLKRHLEGLDGHPAQLKEYRRLQAIRDSQKAQMKKLSQEKEGTPQRPGLFKFYAKLDPNCKRAKDITYAISLFMCKGLQPYAVVSHAAFQFLMHVLEPRYEIPHRTTFSRKIIPELFKKLRKEMLQFIESERSTMESISVTTDMWTSRSKDSFIAFTLQFIDRFFQMHHLMFDIQPFHGSHDAVSILKCMLNALKELGFLPDWYDGDEVPSPGDVATYIISDNGPNVVCALEQPSERKKSDHKVPVLLRQEKPWTHLRCTDHTLQLAIGDFVEDLNGNNIIDKASKLVAHYSRSHVSRDSLAAFQKEHGLPEHELIQMVSTRWNSEYLMLQRLVEQKLAVVSERSASGEDCFNANEWKLAEGFVEVLQPIAGHTAELGSATLPTLSCVIPVLYEIRKDLEEFVKKARKGSGIQFARSLMEHLEDRFPNYEYKHNDIYVLAMLLDPRYKDVLCDGSANSLLQSAAEAKYREHMRRGLIEQNNSESCSARDPTAPPDPKKPKLSHFQKLSLKKNGSGKSKDWDEAETIKREVEAYLKAPLIGPKDDPLLWWRANKAMYPYLTPVARHYLGIPATEVPSERVFSQGGNVCTSKRTNITSEHLREQVFCHENAKIPRTR